MPNMFASVNLIFNQKQESFTHSRISFHSGTTSTYWCKLCECWKIRKKLCFSTFVKHVHKNKVLLCYNEYPKSRPPPLCKHNCPSLFPTIIFIHHKLHLKISNQKWANRYIKFRIGTHLGQQSFLFLYLPFIFYVMFPFCVGKSFFMLCSHFVLEKLVIRTRSGATIV